LHDVPLEERNKVATEFPLLNDLEMWADAKREKFVN
jgi:hypothetical protein